MHNQPSRVTTFAFCFLPYTDHATMQIMYRLPPLSMMLVYCIYMTSRPCTFPIDHTIFTCHFPFAFALDLSTEENSCASTQIQHQNYTTAPPPSFCRHVRMIDPDACPHNTNSLHQSPPPPPISPFRPTPFFPYQHMMGISYLSSPASSGPGRLQLLQPLLQRPVSQWCATHNASMSEPSTRLQSHPPHNSVPHVPPPDRAPRRRQHHPIAPIQRHPRTDRHLHQGCKACGC